MKALLKKLRLIPIAIGAAIGSILTFGVTHATQIATTASAVKSGDASTALVTGSNVLSDADSAYKATKATIDSAASDTSK